MPDTTKRYSAANRNDKPQRKSQNVKISSYREGTAVVRQIVRSAAKKTAKQLVEQFEKTKQVCGNDLMKSGIQFSH